MASKRILFVFAFIFNFSRIFPANIENIDANGTKSNITSNISSIVLQTTFFPNKVREFYWCSNPDKIDDNLNENPKVLLGMLESGKIFRSEDGGQTFISLELNTTIFTIKQHPSFANVLYFFSFTRNLIYISENCGYEIKSVKDLTLPVENLIFNYGDPKYILVKSLDSDYFSSEDFGERWREIANFTSSNVKKIEWAHHQHNLIKSKNVQRIIAHIGDDVFYTEDLFVTHHLIQRNVSNFTLQSNFLIMSVFENSELRIFITDVLDFVDPVSTVHHALIPRLPENISYFSCLEFDEIIYLLIGSANTNLTLLTAPMTPEYKFIVSLANVFSPKQSYTEKTLTGILIANQMLEQMVIRTSISFNKGTTWQPLKNHNSSETLSLDLQTMFSFKFAIGLLICTGNIGDRLNPSESNIYLSRNGGFSWHEIRKGRHLLAVSDLGSLVVLASEDLPTKELLYSWDQGLTFETFTFSKNLVKILSISMEPNTFSQTLIIFAQSVNTTQGIVFSVKFNQIICQGIWDPNTSESDYETWIPDSEFSKCVLGKKMSVVRKKREASCFNPEIDRPVIETYCDCEERDFQCDFGFTFNTSGNTCEKKDIVHNDKECLNGYVTVLTGYRKIPGDGCTGGIDKGYYQKKCENDVKFDSNKGARKPDWKDYLIKNYFIITVCVMSVLLCCFHKVIEEFFSDRLSSFKNLLEFKMSQKREKRFLARLREDKNTFEHISEVTEDQETSSLIS